MATTSVIKKTKKQIKEEEQKLVEVGAGKEFCRRCGPLVSMDYNCASGRFPGSKEHSNADIVFVGEAPGQEEIRQGAFFVGKAGRELESWLQEAGFTKTTKVYLDNAVRCSLRDRDLSNYTTQNRKKIITQCRPYLMSELTRLKPKVIVPLGNTALSSITGQTGIMSWRGRTLIHPGLNAYIVPALHPAAVLRGNSASAKTNSIEDMRLAKRLLSLPRVKIPKMETIFVRTKEQANQMLAEMESSTAFVTDVETQGTNQRAGKLIGIAFSASTTRGYFFPVMDIHIDRTVETGEAWTVDKEHPLWIFYKKRIKKLLEDKRKTKIMHNAGYDLKWLRQQGIVCTPIFDTMIANGIVDPAIGNDLKGITWAHTPFGGYEDEIKVYRTKDFTVFPPTKLATYSGYDGIATKIIEGRHQESLLTHPAKFIAKEFMELRMNLSEMEFNGVPLDLPYTQRQIDGYIGDDGKKIVGYDDRVTAQGKKLAKIIGVKDFNANSAPQVLEALFEKTSGLFDIEGLPYFKGRGGEIEASADKHALAHLLTVSKNSFRRAKSFGAKQQAKKQRDFIENLMAYRVDTKILNTYLKRFMTSSVASRIHTEYTTAETITARLSSREPNLQNIPRGSLVRGCVFAPTGMDLIELDYSQLEIRIAADYCEDEHWINLLNSGHDTHVFVGMNTIAQTMKKADKSKWCEQDFKDEFWRAKAKIIGFSIIYGKTAMGLANDLDIDEDQAAEIIESLLNTFPNLRKWVKSQHDFVALHGYVETLFGRQIPVDNWDSTLGFKRAGAYRASVNYPVQSGASDCVILAVNRIFREIKSGKLKAKPVLTVHDSILFECDEKHSKRTAAQIKEIMEEPLPQLKHVKLVADCKVGKRWGQLQKLKLAA